uniref:Uncharacterized protein n=2 Tax=Lepeophtheirus salmonis TaxID=72036 RepID=A0A0K2T9C3_LEPSM
MKGFSTLKLTKKAISELIKDLIPLIDAVFGPHKGAILVKIISPSSMKIVKSGKDILSLFERKHPIYKQLSKFLKNHVEQYGDGSKTVLLLINYFLYKIEEIEYLSKVHTLREMVKIKEGFLPLLHSNPIKESLIPMDPCKILSSFFSSRFSESVSQYLIDNILYIYERSIPLKKFASKSILIEYEGIASSRVLHLVRKYLLDHTFSNPMKIDPKNFIVWIREEGNDSTQKISITTNKKTMDLSDFVSIQDRKIESFIHNALKSREIHAILCNFGLEDNLKYQLFKDRILVVEYMDTDELQDLCDEINIQPWKGEVGDEIHEMNIGETDGFEELYLANNSVKTVMKLPKYSNLSFFHPIICGPTLAIAKSYYESSYEGLSLLYSNNKGMTKFGDFEKHGLHLFLMDYLLKNGRSAETVHLIYMDLLTYWTTFSRKESNARRNDFFYYGYDTNINILTTFHEIIEFFLRTEYILPIKAKVSSQEAIIQ